MTRSFSIKDISIRKADCVTGMSKLGDNSVDLVFADPPYNLSHKKLENRKSNTGGAFYKVQEKWDKFTDENYMDFTVKWISQVKRTLRPGGAIYVCASQHNLAVVLANLESLGLVVKNIIVWEKPNAMPNLTRRTLTHSVEFVVWAVNGKGWKFDYESLRALNPDRQKDGQPRMMRDVWRFPVVQGAERLQGPNGRALHPTQKPEALVHRCVVASSDSGDLVVDPFSGSGTTAVVCAGLKRRFIGFEVDAGYVVAARKRIQTRFR